MSPDPTPSGLYDVAVVGFGPSGAVAAALLGQAGVRTLVCEREREVYDKPRAIALDHEILRVFQRLGLLDQVLPHTEPFTDSLYYGVDGQLIRRLSSLPEPYPMALPPSLVFNQPAVESVLRRSVERFPNVDVALGVELRSLQQDAERVTLGLAARGQPLSCQARYVIGCDGASSTVRELLQLELADLDFDEAWLVVDALVNARGLAKLPRTSVQYCEPARPASFVIGPKQHRRWEIALNEGDDARQAATPQGTWELLRRWLTPDDARLWRQASYRFHALCARDWRRGRVFIAGDAAHQQPPFLGQGMCQGIRDVTNLSWKLAAVLDQRAPQSLLDTYAEERGQHVAALTARIKSIGAVICERNLERARARDAAFLAACGGSVRPEPRQNLQPSLDRGCLSALPHAARGALFPQPWLADARQPGGRIRMDDRLGSGWRLILDPACPEPELPEGLSARLKLSTSVAPLAGSRAGQSEIDGVLQRWMSGHRALAAIVRPDNYVFGVAETVSDLSSTLKSLATFFA